MKNLYTQIVVEGTDLIGKTTVVSDLKKIFPVVRDRADELSHNVLLDMKEGNYIAIKQYVDSQPATLFVFMSVLRELEDSVLGKRMIEREATNGPLDEFDADCIRYNQSYSTLMLYLNKCKNVLMVYVDDDSVPFDTISAISNKVVSDSFEAHGFNEPVIVGESKRIYKLEDANLSIIKLIPTLYSFTHNRYDTVDGTDLLRNKFWQLFSRIINRTYSKYKIDPEYRFCDMQLNKLLNEYSGNGTVLSSYISHATLDGVEYNIAIWEDELPPIEVVWKMAHYGTMKHNLKDVDKYNTRSGAPIRDEGRYPQSFIRFDWRNPLPHKDECIPDEFAEFYTNTKNAKPTARLVTHILTMILTCKGYNLIDLCYFINENGDTIFSEITPDGMRIQKAGESFDKDLWRVGKEKSELVDVWANLYNDLKEIESLF